MTAAERGRGATLRRRVGRASIAMVAVLAVMFAMIVLALLDFKDKGDDVIDRWQPAATLSQDVLADLVNQETGLRGYALGQQPSFLQPYYKYKAEQARQQVELRALISSRPDLVADLDKFVAAADHWRATIAVPYIDRARRGDRTVRAAVASDAAKSAFDRIREASNTLTDRLVHERTKAKSARTRAMYLVWAAVVVSFLLVLLRGWGIWRGLRTSVLAPIEHLAAQTRHVAAGAIGERIEPAGPPEIAGLAADVNLMRARIANELTRVELARARLAERTDELARSNADLEQFAYVASHDLSEPLRKVANFCQLLERQYAPQLDDKAKQYIAFAVDGAKRMQILIGDLLSFSRVGRTTEAFEPVDLNDALARALGTLEERAAAAGADIVRGPLPTVDGDATLLVALFQNLVGNAIKYRDPDRPPRIEISAAEAPGGEWLFTVADNGIGIDQQYAERIFTIFQRLHLRDKYGGTGIGLALCRKIVEFHRGRIWLAEGAGPGATFQFTIPEHGGPDYAGAEEY